MSGTKDKKKYTITHMNKSLVTTHWIYIPDDVCESIRKKYYEKPDRSDVDTELCRLADGKNLTSYVKAYYFKDLMMKVRIYSARWSIEEMLQCNDLIRYYYSRMLANKKVCPPNKSLQSNFETIVRIGGGRVAMNPSNFPIKTVDLILQKYNINNKYYDFSCGWGIRLLSSLRNNVEYYGSDPNDKLFCRLIQLKNDYNRINKTHIKTDIRCMGSETYIPEWKEKFGLIFSSPPYYILEDYRIGNQSIYDNTGIKSYEKWMDTYIKPTIKNCVKYLIPGGYLALNIKNTMSLPMYDDIYTILSNNNELDFVSEEKLINIKRPSKTNNLNTDEKIMVFSKRKTKTPKRV